MSGFSGFSFSQAEAEMFVPDGGGLTEALGRVTHVGVGAHADDLEIFAYHGIEACFGRADAGFLGVTVTDGRGCVRAGPYANFTEAEMVETRRREQRRAAVAGDYAAQAQLMHRSGGTSRAREDLAQIFTAVCGPETTVYLHQPMDRHDTHVAVLWECLAALRRLPADRMPERVYGCEVWRDLDWLGEEDRIALDSGRRPHLAAALLGVFDSQIAAGKRYDLATLGRRRANATFADPRRTDGAESVTWAVNLSPLLLDTTMTLEDYIQPLLERFRQDVTARIRRMIGQ